jgi:hypothetical protein
LSLLSRVYPSSDAAETISLEYLWHGEKNNSTLLNPACIGFLTSLVRGKKVAARIAILAFYEPITIPELLLISSAIASGYCYTRENSFYIDHSKLVIPLGSGQLSMEGVCLLPLIKGSHIIDRAFGVNIFLPIKLILSQLYIYTLG